MKGDEVGGPNRPELGAAREGAGSREGCVEDGLGQTINIFDGGEKRSSKEGVEEREGRLIVKEGEKSGTGHDSARKGRGRGLRTNTNQDQSVSQQLSKDWTVKEATFLGLVDLVLGVSGAGDGVVRSETTRAQKG